MRPAIVFTFSVTRSLRGKEFKGYKLTPTYRKAEMDAHRYKGRLILLHSRACNRQKCSRLIVSYILKISITPVVLFIQQTNINQRGGKSSLHIGHCSLNFIQFSRQAVWKMCRHGVTIYILRANTPVTLMSSSPALTMGTSSNSLQIAQSMVRVTPPPGRSLSLSSLLRPWSWPGLSSGFNPMGKAPASTLSSRSTG